MSHPETASAGAESPLQAEPAAATRSSAALIWSFLCRLDREQPLLLLVFVAWVSSFLHFERFGYYEDDWYYLPAGFSQSFVARLKALLPIMVSFFQGRPILLFFETVFAWTTKINTALPYVFVFILFVATALLFYRVLRIRFPRHFAFLTVLLFILSPLTTVRQNLVIGFIMGPAFICAFTAILNRRRRPVLTYLLAGITILTYEAVFLLIFMGPFFERGRLNARKLRVIARHWAICGLITVAAVALRVLLGEARVAGAASAGPVAILLNVIGFDLYYVARSFLTYAYAVRSIWMAGSLESLIYLAMFLPASIFIFRGFTRAFRPASGARIARTRIRWWVLNGFVFGLALNAAGFLTIFFQNSGYPILFNGRDTRFLATAVPGNSMIVVSLVMIAHSLGRPLLTRLAAVSLTAVYSVCFLYSFVVQDDYVRAWDYQKNFLSQLVLLTPDLQPNGVVVVRTGINPLPGYGSWARPNSIGWQRFGLLVSLRSLGDWVSSPEIVFLNDENWKSRLKIGPDGNLHWTQPESGSTAAFVVPGRVIIVDEAADGLLTRSDEPVMIDGRDVTQKSAINLALHKPARQSSTFGPFVAPRGVDGVGLKHASAWEAISKSGLLPRIVSPIAKTALGDTPGLAAAASGFHTDSEPSPWWEVDLEHRATIQSVRIYNSQPMFFSRARTLRVLVSDDDRNWKLVYDNAGRVFGPEPLIVPMNGEQARYVRVQLAEPNYLHLEEVEVLGR